MIDFTLMNFAKDFDYIRRAAIEELTRWGDQGRPIQQYGLGFYKLPFYTDRLRDGCALHIWPEGLPTTDNIHTHISDLDSLDLLNGLTNEIWTLAPSSKGTHEKRLFIGADDLRPTGDFFNIKLVATQVVTAGQHYTVPKGVFHSTKITHFPTVTLVRRRNVDPNETVMDLTPRDAPARTYAVPSDSYQNMWG